RRRRARAPAARGRSRVGGPGAGVGAQGRLRAEVGGGEGGARRGAGVEGAGADRLRSRHAPGRLRHRRQGGARHHARAARRRQRPRRRCTRARRRSRDRARRHAPARADGRRRGQAQRRAGHAGRARPAGDLDRRHADRQGRLRRRRHRAGGAAPRHPPDGHRRGVPRPRLRGPHHPHRADRRSQEPRLRGRDHDRQPRRRAQARHDRRAQAQRKRRRRSRRRLAAQRGRALARPCRPLRRLRRRSKIGRTDRAPARGRAGRIPRQPDPDPRRPRRRRSGDRAGRDPGLRRRSGPGDPVSADHKSDSDRVEHDRSNVARYFTETRHVAWVLLAGTVLWGAFSYVRMPKAKDPLVPVRVAVATCTWPGASAEKLEELVTRKLEQKIAESSKVEKIESISRSSVAIVYVTLKEDVADRGKELDDIKGKLDSIHDLPQGAGPINFIKDFGDTAALMITVASPKVGDVELTLRARSVAHAIAEVRQSAAVPQHRATLVVAFPPSINSRPLRRAGEAMVRALGDGTVGTDARPIEGPGFLGIDLSTKLDDRALVAAMLDVARERLRLSELHPDVWFPTVIRDPKDAEERLARVVGDRYSYRELDEYTDKIQRYLQTVAQVSKVTR